MTLLVLATLQGVACGARVVLVLGGVEEDMVGLEVVISFN